MRKTKYLFYIPILLCLLIAMASAQTTWQMQNDNFAITPGSPVGGGGTSISEGHYTVVGSVGGSVGGASVSVGHFASGGVMGGAFGRAGSIASQALPDADYRIVGVPVNILGQTDADNVLADDLGGYDIKYWRFGRYDNEDGVTYEHGSASIPDFTPGLGYWLIARGSKTIDATGLPVIPNLTLSGDDYYLSDSPDLTLGLGWNQLANPFGFAISWSDVRYKAGIFILGAMSAVVQGGNIYYYQDGGWTNPDFIPAWGGFFVYVTTDQIEPVFPYWPAGVLASNRNNGPIATVSEDNWTVNLALKNGSWVDAGNHVGVRNTAQAGLDHTDLLKPPPAPGMPMLAMTIEGEKPALSADYRQPFSSGDTWRLRFSDGENRTLALTGLDQIPDGMQAWLIFNDENRVSPVEGGEIILKNETRGAELVIGTEDYLTHRLGDLLPMDFALHQNYPNPFNPTTTIRFDLPNEAFVRLDVYNILGRKVKTLIDQPMQPGYHSVDWDGSDNAGHTIASGIYFYRLAAGDKVDKKKMVLLK